MSRKQDAMRVLTYYFELAGLQLNNDMRVEIQGIVEDIIAASIAELKEELQAKEGEHERALWERYRGG